MGAHGASLGLLALALVIVAMVMPIQTLDRTCAQTSTFALVRALRDGTPHIDRYQQETCDKSYRNGNFFSNKAPGLALAVLPLYAALDLAHLLPDNERTLLWILSLWSSVLPAAVMLLLIRRIANRFDPETGTLVAVAIGLATLTLPLATVAFGHILAATLLLAAFALALDARDAESRPWMLIAAGALAGYAITTEYPAGIVALAIGIYAAATTRALRRLLAFALGGAIGLTPLLLYNQWAFRSAISLSYTDAVKDVGPDGVVDVGNHDAGFYGVLLPSLSAAMRILISDRGLLAVTPIMILCIVGVVLLARQGFRAEAIAIGAIAAGMLIYNASLTISAGWVYGGDGPGPRYLYLGVPFALLPLGLVFRKAPAVVAALVTASFAWMALATVTQPLVGSEGPLQWLRLVRLGMFAETPLSLLGAGSGWVAISPLLVVIALAFIAFVAAATTVPRAPFSTTVFATTIGAWAFVTLVGRDIVLATGTTAALIALGTVAAGCLLVVAAVTLPEPRGPVPVSRSPDTAA